LPQLSATYDYWLVSLSFVVAILTSYTAVDLAARVTANQVLLPWAAGVKGKRDLTLNCVRFH
jgi:NO-binding membrane sensor protein with MHYT domain